MKATVITIGDEILLGQIVDTNSRFMAQQLTRIGAETVEMRSVADTQEAIISCLRDVWDKTNAVFITGGLGPTKDDVTKQALADFFGTEMEKNATATGWLQDFFAKPLSSLNAYNQMQAVLPKSCIPLYNPKGTACGMWFEKDGKVLVSMPGVPFEMETIFTREVLPRLKKTFTGLNLTYRLLTVHDISESALALRLADFEQSLPEGIKLAYLPSVHFVRLRLTATGSSAEEADRYFAQLQQDLQGLHYVLENEETQDLQALLGDLRRTGKTVACAESCTGGMIAHLLTSEPGASSYFLGGVIAYANSVKEQVLGVQSQDLQQYGAVSEPVALQMAQGVRRLTGADYAVATTGVAGPDGGSEEKPVGTVWIALAGPSGATAQKFTFSRTRERNIGRAADKALRLLVEAAKEK